jgi:hypothetical protein
MVHFETMQDETCYLCYQTLNIKHSVCQNWYEYLQQILEEPSQLY